MFWDEKVADLNAKILTSLHKDNNAVYFFQISFFIQKIFKFLKYAN